MLFDFDFSDMEMTFARRAISGNSAGRKRIWLKLAKLLDNGVQIKVALESMRTRRVRAKGAKDAVAVAYGEWISEINNGKRFSDAIIGWVPPEEVMLISSGEQSGRMEASLHSAVSLIDSGDKIKSAVIGGLMYPAILILMAFGTLYLFGYKVIPGFARILPEDRWTGLAANMVDVSHFVQNWLWLVALLLIVVIASVIWSLSRWNGAIRTKLDAYPPYSIYRLVKGSTWMIALSSLVEAGVRAETAFQMLGERASPWLKERNDACLHGMRNGYSIGDALARSGHNFPDAEIIDDLGVYSSLSSFDQALAVIGKETMASSIESIQGVMKIVFNAGIAVVGVLLFWMIGGMLAMQVQMSSALTG